MSRAPCGSSSTRSTSSPRARVSSITFALAQLRGHLTPRRSRWVRRASVIAASAYARVDGNAGGRSAVAPGMERPGRAGRGKAVGRQVVEPGADGDLELCDGARGRRGETGEPGKLVAGRHALAVLLGPGDAVAVGRKINHESVPARHRRLPRPPAAAPPVTPSPSRGGPPGG